MSEPFFPHSFSLKSWRYSFSEMQYLARIIYTNETAFLSKFSSFCKMLARGREAGGLNNRGDSCITISSASGSWKLLRMK